MAGPREAVNHIFPDMDQRTQTTYMHSLPFQPRESTTSGGTVEMDLTFVFVKFLRQELKYW